jgi:hypothetical protein
MRHLDLVGGKRYQADIDNETDFPLKGHFAAWLKWPFDGAERFGAYAK